MYRSNRVIYAVLTIFILLTTVLVYTGDSKAAAQNTACIGSAEYIANHQLAEQAIAAQIEQHKDIYSKDSSQLTTEDYQTVATDVAFYAGKLAEIQAPLAVRATLMTEIAMYYTLSALLYSTIDPSILVDLTALYNDAGTSLSAALLESAKALIVSCPAYDGVYGKYLATASA